MELYMIEVAFFKRVAKLKIDIQILKMDFYLFTSLYYFKSYLEIP